MLNRVLFDQQSLGSIAASITYYLVSDLSLVLSCEMGITPAFSAPHVRITDQAMITVPGTEQVLISGDSNYHYVKSHRSLLESWDTNPCLLSLV